MEPVSEPAKRALELALDAVVEQLADLPEGEEKRELTERMRRLDEAWAWLWLKVL